MPTITIPIGIPINPKFLRRSPKGVIANEFSGKLSQDQERIVPEALRGAFTVESLRRITAPELAKELEFKTLVAEESLEGERYVAIKDYRHVEFSPEVSGQMIVIERYVVVPE